MLRANLQTAKSGATLASSDPQLVQVHQDTVQNTMLAADTVSSEIAPHAEYAALCACQNQSCCLGAFSDRQAAFAAAGQRPKLLLAEPAQAGATIVMLAARRDCQALGADQGHAQPAGARMQ